MLNKKSKIKVSNYNLEPKKSFRKETLFIAAVLIILLSIAGFIYYPRSSAIEQPVKELSKTEEKAKIMSRVNISLSGDKPLNQEEKNEIYSKISGTKIQDFNLSDEEKNKLLRMLNTAK